MGTLLARGGAPANSSTILKGSVTQPLRATGVPSLCLQGLLPFSVSIRQYGPAAGKAGLVASHSLRESGTDHQSIGEVWRYGVPVNDGRDRFRAAFLVAGIKHRPATALFADTRASAQCVPAPGIHARWWDDVSAGGARPGPDLHQGCS